ncbi:STAS domain-containing protein [Bacillaceae bacterium IKA-2]|nr:STAS domain-containing protein [Bacillaceae bacterium IKA-2]
MDLEINHIKKEGKQFIFLKGEIDVYTSVKLKEILIPLTDIAENEVIVDLAQVSYIDSTGLGIFIGALKSTHKNNSSLKLIGLVERVRRLFRITGLDEVIDIEESKREEAK